MAPIQLSSQSQKAWDEHVSAIKNTPRFQEHETIIVAQPEIRQLRLTDAYPGFKEAQAHMKDLEPIKNVPTPSLDVQTTLKYTFDVIREQAPPNGLYPLFITLHGGGGAPGNDALWAAMTTYYKGAVKTGPKAGIYLALRGIGDSWDMHFTPASYELVQRLIENMIMFEKANPNRVYVLGFSAGGDGVYSLSAYLANRFAAANMSAGHPGGVNLRNIVNVPLCLQVGEDDTGTKETRGDYRGYNRSLVAAEKNLLLTQWRSDYSTLGLRVYDHETFLHPTTALAQGTMTPEKYAEELYAHKHNSWEDQDFLAAVPRPLSTVVADVDGWRVAYNTKAEKPNMDMGKKLMDTNAVDWVFARTRDPVPQCIVWDLTTRPNPPDHNIPLSDRQSDPLLVRKGLYYWLDIGARTREDLGIDLIQARIERNTIIVDFARTYLRILLRNVEGMLDLRQMVTIVLPKPPGASAPQTISLVVQAEENALVIEQTLALNDPSYIFTADIVLTQDGGVGPWSASRTPHPSVAPKL